MFWGDTGTGKTHFAINELAERDELRGGSDVYRWVPPEKEQQEWWPNYAGETGVVLDEFEGQISYTRLKVLLDVWAFCVPTKGGFVNANFTDIIITSPIPWKSWYADRECSELERRLNGKIENYSKPYVDTNVVTL